MDNYELEAKALLRAWQRKMLKRSSLTSQFAKGIQVKISSIIPDKIHEIITGAIKTMVTAVLLGSEYISGEPLIDATLEEREELVKDRLEFYKKAAATSGAGTGAGGFLLALTDFPILLGLKMKFLFDTATMYGFDVKDYKERLYILHIFQLAFSSDQRRIEIYKLMVNWQQHTKLLPQSIDEFDWRTFQQEYRDYIDLAKMLQMVPGIGIVVGAVVNYRLMDKLGETAKNSYRLRLLNND